MFWLSDEAWSSIESYLLGIGPSARHTDDRRVISGILTVLKVGCRWRDLPTAYGPVTTVYNRYYRWSRCSRLLDALVDVGVLVHSEAIDSAYAQARRALRADG